MVAWGSKRTSGSYIVKVENRKGSRKGEPRGAEEERLVTVVLGLEGTVSLDTEVLSLLGVEGGEVDADVLQVRAGDLLVEVLGEHVDANGVLSGVGPEGDLGEHLVAEGVGHDERRVSRSATQVDETSGGQQDEVAAVLEQEAVYLRLDVDLLGRILLQPGYIDLSIEVTNVAKDGVVGHGLEVSSSQDIAASGGGDEDLSTGSGLLHGDDLITLHSGLQSVDGINLSDENASSHSAERLGASLSDVSVSGDNGRLSGDHNVRSALDTVQQGLAASVQVIKLGLGDRIVHVDRGELELSLLHAAVQVVDSSGGLLGQTYSVSTRQAFQAPFRSYQPFTCVRVASQGPKDYRVAK